MTTNQTLRPALIGLLIGAHFVLGLYSFMTFPRVQHQSAVAQAAYVRDHACVDTGEKDTNVRRQNALWKCAEGNRQFKWSAAELAIAMAK